MFDLQKQSLGGETTTNDNDEGDKRQIQGSLTLPEEQLQRGVQPETHGANLPIIHHHMNRYGHHGKLGYLLTLFNMGILTRKFSKVFPENLDISEAYSLSLIHI